MMKKKMTRSIALAIAFSFIFLMASCAKKQVKVEEAGKPSGREIKKEEERAVERPGKREEDAAAMRAAEAKRRARLRGLEVSRKLRGEIRAFESENIFFDFDKFNLMPEARAVLAKKAEWLRANPEYSVRIEGHCDERGTNEYNLALGERRANAAWKFLNALGISGDRLSTISYGEERPADPRSNDEAWTKNRRAEFKLIR